MMDEKTVIKTIEQLMKAPNLNSHLRYKLREAIDPKAYIISWHIDDLESLASNREEEGETLYDRSEFGYALELAISNHDANNGISWDVLDYYLDEYCLIAEE